MFLYIRNICSYIIPLDIVWSSRVSTQMGNAFATAFGLYSAHQTIWDYWRKESGKKEHLGCEKHFRFCSKSRLLPAPVFMNKNVFQLRITKRFAFQIDLQANERNSRSYGCKFEAIWEIHLQLPLCCKTLHSVRWRSTIRANNWVGGSKRVRDWIWPRASGL